MILVGRDRLVEFAKRHPVAAKRANAWALEAQRALWKTPHDIKRQYPRASIVDDLRVVFDLGQSYRLGAYVSYAGQVVSVQLVGTHAEYDRWGNEW